MELTECPKCGSKEIWIYEYYHMLRRYPPDAVDAQHYDDEYWLTGDCLTFTCEKCEHEWLSEDATQIDDLLSADTTRSIWCRKSTMCPSKQPHNFMEAED